VKGAGGSDVDFGTEAAPFTLADYGVCIASQYNPAETD